MDEEGFVMILCSHCKKAEAQARSIYCKACDTLIKNGSCSSCGGQFCFFPENKHYAELSNNFSFICDNCIKKCYCVSCNTGRGDILICENCDIAGAMCLKCAGLDKVPEEQWYCSATCRNKTAPSKKRDRDIALLDNELLLKKVKCCDGLHRLQTLKTQIDKAKLELDSTTETHKALMSKKAGLEDVLKKVTALQSMFSKDIRDKMQDLRTTLRELHQVTDLGKTKNTELHALQKEHDSLKMECDEIMKTIYQ